VKKKDKSEKERCYARSQEDRLWLAKKLLRHLEDGYSMDCFYFVSRAYLRSLFEQFPEDFPAEDIERARLKGQLMWEDIGKRQSEGTCLGNSRSWYYNMSNRFGWTDKQKIDHDIQGKVSVSVVSYASPS
jgi:hypothetical protein